MHLSVAGLAYTAQMKMVGLSVTDGPSVNGRGLSLDPLNFKRQHQHV